MASPNEGYFLPMWAIQTFAGVIVLLLAVIGSLLSMGISRLHATVCDLKGAVKELSDMFNSWKEEANDKFISKSLFDYVQKNTLEDIAGVKKYAEREISETRTLIDQVEARAGKALTDCKSLRGKLKDGGEK